MKEDREYLKKLFALMHYLEKIIVVDELTKNISCEEIDNSDDDYRVNKIIHETNETLQKIDYYQTAKEMLENNDFVILTKKEFEENYIRKEEANNV